MRDSSADFGVTEAALFGAAIPIGGIAGDQQAAAVGQACFAPGMIKSTFGTGCFVLLNTGGEAARSRNRLLTTVAYRLGGETTYAIEGSVFAAGAAIQWLRDGLGVIAEAAESEAALLAARRRRLADIAWEATQAGKRIQIRVGSRKVAGMPTYARNDLMSLRTPNGILEVYLPNIDALLVMPGFSQGRSVAKDVETFAARMAMLQLTREHVEIVCRGGDPRFDGTVDYVARDHVALTSAAATVFIALGAIAYVVCRPELR